MVFNAIKIAALVSGFCSAVQAGTPIAIEVTCSVGGEEFLVTGTMSCSTMGRRLTLRPISSCDFVTVLPVCPSNGLPLFRDFTEEEVARLTEFVETEDYQALMPLSEWERAYRVHQFLGPASPGEGYYLLRNFFWHQPTQFRAALAANWMLDEIGSFAELGPSDDIPFDQTITAYALAWSNMPELARQQLEMVDVDGEENDYLRQYVTRISGCIDRIADKDCLPMVEFIPDE